MKRTNWLEKSCRRGVAPLEFVMILPLFVLFLTLMFYVADAAVVQLNLANRLRNDVWNVRNVPASENCQNQVAPLDFFQGTQGSLEARSEEDIKNGNFFDFWKHKASSNHQLFNGSWATNSNDAKYPNESGLYERLRNDVILSDCVDSDSLAKLPLSFCSKDLSATPRRP